MAEKRHRFSVPAKSYGFPPEAYDPSLLPDVDTNFLSAEDLEAFIQALGAPDPLQEDTRSMRLGSPGLRSETSLDVDLTKRNSVSINVEDDPQAVAAQAAALSAEATAPSALAAGNGNGNGIGVGEPSKSRDSLFISAQNDWAPVNQKVVRPRRSRRRKPKGTVVGRRTKDETREGYLYGLLKWPFLLIVGGWILGLALAYLATRTYIWMYEHYIAWRGRRERLRRAMRATANYRDWVRAAKELDAFLGTAERWKEENEFAYYDSKTVRRVWESMRKARQKAEAEELELANGDNGQPGGGPGGKAHAAVDDLKALIEACVKNNFVGIENPRLYSQTYYGTKNLVQNYIDELERSLTFLKNTKQLDIETKRFMFKGINGNYGRSALCLSGGASFAYYHFGVVKALLEADFLPDVITGTSGGALVAALVATRTNEELKHLLVPALAARITACSEPPTVWVRRWWKTGARFDSINWAKQCSWWTRGSMTFREAYERTGRILNVSCVPSDPHSPTILCNYLTSPDCVIWSAVLASAAVPGILNPVVLMMKTPSGQLVPYSFGHKWKDGSLRTDIPIKALNLHFNVNFTIVSQVNPHINLFFFSSRGSVGQPVTHRRGRGWRGGYLGSSIEQYLKLDMRKWLKVLRQLELLPRPLGQDWSMLWLQEFGGTTTIWPKSVPSDFWRLLSDPDAARLARMVHEGQQSAFPKLKFVANRLRIERLVEAGRRESRGWTRRGSIETIISEDELKHLLLRTGAGRGGVEGSGTGTEDDDDEATDVEAEPEAAAVERSSLLLPGGVVVEDGAQEIAVVDDDDEDDDRFPKTTPRVKEE